MLIRIKIILVVFSICLLNIFSCSNDQELSERKQLFDLNWKFCQGDISSAYQVDYNDNKWQSIDLPHDWSLDKKINSGRTNVHGSSNDAIGWYRKKFSIPSDWQNMKVSVQFENDQLKASVFINGAYIGANSDTSESFLFDITSYLKYDKENVIAVQVDHSNQVNGQWIRGTGISEHVWLLLSDPIAFKR